MGALKPVEESHSCTSIKPAVVVMSDTTRDVAEAGTSAAVAVSVDKGAESGASGAANVMAPAGAPPAPIFNVVTTGDCAEDTAHADFAGSGTPPKNASVDAFNRIPREPARGDVGDVNTTTSHRVVLFSESEDTNKIKRRKACKKGEVRRIVGTLKQSIPK